MMPNRPPVQGWPLLGPTVNLTVPAGFPPLAFSPWPFRFFLKASRAWFPFTQNPSPSAPVLGESPALRFALQNETHFRLLLVRRRSRIVKTVISILVFGVTALAALSAQEGATNAPKGYILLTGDAAAPYATACREALSRISLRLPRAELDQIHREVFGAPLDFAPPEIPSTRGPFVYREQATSQVIAYYAIGFMGYFETAFSSTTPPTVSATYFMDAEHKQRLTSLAALHRDSAKRIKQQFDALRQQPPNKISK
jgi:hypothetical protein